MIVENCAHVKASIIATLKCCNDGWKKDYGGFGITAIA